MQAPERLIIAGMFLVFIGVLLITLSSAPSGSGFFFIFPFIFVGELSSPMVALLLAAVGIIFFILFFSSSRLLSPTWIRLRQANQEGYVKLSSYCDTCNAAAPEAAVFCPSCGNTLRDDTTGVHY